MIGHVGVHRANDAHVVDMKPSRPREEVTDLNAALAVFLETKRRAHGRTRLAPVRRFGPGRGLPWYFISMGLGSNVSMCEGPPFMNR